MSRLLLPLQHHQAYVERAIRAAVEDMGPMTRLREACGYALLNGGKRLRPAIVLSVAEALEVGAEAVIKAALATEFFHTASLIADDLPCMDDAEERRSRPALHVVYGEDVALLASYALISEGYQALADNVARRRADAPDGPWDRVGVLALENASRNTGIRGTTGGQFLDLHPPEGLDDVLPTLLHMKTTTLFEISFVFGWLFGGGAPARLSEVVALSRDFGLAYQIADDLDDLEEDAASGRAVNYALRFGEAAADARLCAALEACVAGASSLGLRSGALAEVMGLLRRTPHASPLVAQS